METTPTNRRTASKIRTTEKVLEAARKLFARDGFKAATIRAIAAEAGMSTGAVFANYKDKTDLYRAAHGHDPITPEQGVRLLEIARFVTNLSSESQGVAGYHLNGTVADWGEFEQVAAACALVAEISPKETTPCNT